MLVRSAPVPAGPLVVISPPVLRASPATAVAVVSATVVGTGHVQGYTSGVGSSSGSPTAAGDTGAQSSRPWKGRSQATVALGCPEPFPAAGRFPREHREQLSVSTGNTGVETIRAGDDRGLAPAAAVATVVPA
jgi:hypothetical protein